MKIFKFIHLVFYFSWEVVLANLQVAKLLLFRHDDITPAIVAVPLTVQKDSQILILSSMITLTPGTLSLDVSSDKKLLFVHVIHTDSPDGTIAEIKAGFEKWVMEVFP